MNTVKSVTFDYSSDPASFDQMVANYLANGWTLIGLTTLPTGEVLCVFARDEDEEDDE